MIHDGLALQLERGVISPFSTEMSSGISSKR